MFNFFRKATAKTGTSNPLASQEEAATQSNWPDVQTEEQTSSVPLFGTAVAIKEVVRREKMGKHIDVYDTTCEVSIPLPEALTTKAQFIDAFKRELNQRFKSEYKSHSTIVEGNTFTLSQYAGSEVNRKDRLNIHIRSINKVIEEINQTYPSAEEMITNHKRELAREEMAAMQRIGTAARNESEVIRKHISTFADWSRQWLREEGIIISDEQEEKAKTLLEKLAQEYVETLAQEKFDKKAKRNGLG